MSSRQKIYDKGKIEGAWTAVRHEVLDCRAWKQTSPGARLLYIALIRRLSFKAYNNGKVYLATRKAADGLGASQRIVWLWFKELEHYGFVEMTEPGAIGPKGRATRWRITDRGWGELDGKPIKATKDYLNWTGDKLQRARSCSTVSLDFSMIFMNVPLFSRYKSCAKKRERAMPHAMRLGQSYSGELIRAKGVRCLYLAFGRHLGRICECPLSGVKRTSRGFVAMSAFDPKRTFVRTRCPQRCRKYAKRRGKICFTTSRMASRYHSTNLHIVVMPSLRVLLYSQKQSPNNPNNGGDKWNHQHSPNKTPSVRWNQQTSVSVGLANSRNKH